MLLLGGCRNAAIPFAGTAPGGRDRVEQAVTALYERYAHVHHGPKYNYTRTRLSSDALVPSRAFDDSAVWTSAPNATTRLVEIGEYVTPAGITEQEAAANVPAPARLGDARHTIELRRLANGDYVWDTDVAIALGTISAKDVADGIVALLTSAGGQTDARMRADYNSAFPRTTAVLSELFSMDTLHATPLPDGSTLVTLFFTLHPDRLRLRYPAFADYMQKYVNSTHYDLSIADHSGAVFFHARADGPPVMVQARVLGHHFLPIAGPSRPMPDSLVLSGSFSTKIKWFTVGVNHFTSDFIIARSEHERSWTLHFRQEPDWRLPMAAERLLRSPLHRPFQDPGVTYALSVRDSTGAQTILTRRSHSEVHESAIMRFIGALISRVVTELGGKVEDEEFAYFGRLFDAMRHDYATVLPTN